MPRSPRMPRMCVWVRLSVFVCVCVSTGGHRGSARRVGSDMWGGCRGPVTTPTYERGTDSHGTGMYVCVCVCVCVCVYVQAIGQRGDGGGAGRCACVWAVEMRYHQRVCVGVCVCVCVACP